MKYPLRSDSTAMEDKVSLVQLLDKHPTPSLQTSRGGTAFHLLVSKLLSRSYFPGDGVPRDQSAEDSWRAQYLTAAFPRMTQAGYSVTQPDSSGTTVVQLLRDGYTSYGERVHQLRHGGLPLAENDPSDEGPLDMPVAIRRALEVHCGEAAPAATSVRMGFGTYAGRLLTELPGGYVVWMCQEPGFFTAADPNKVALLENLGELGLVRRGEDGEEEGELRPAWAPADHRQARLTFGKYRGMLLSDVGKLDPGYIDWMYREPGFFDGTPRKDTLKRQLLALGLVREVKGGVVPAVGKRSRAAFGFGFDDLFGYDMYDYGDMYYYGGDFGAEYGEVEYDGEEDFYDMGEGHDGEEGEEEEIEEGDEDEAEEDEGEGEEEMDETDVDGDEV